jgi:hypothetical protein
MIVANVARIDRRTGLLSNLYRLRFNLCLGFNVRAGPFCVHRTISAISYAGSDGDQSKCDKTLAVTGWRFFTRE